MTRRSFVFGDGFTIQIETTLLINLLVKRVRAYLRSRARGTMHPGRRVPRILPRPRPFPLPLYMTWHLSPISHVVGSKTSAERVLLYSSFPNGILSISWLIRSASNFSWDNEINSPRCFKGACFNKTLPSEEESISMLRLFLFFLTPRRDHAIYSALFTGIPKVSGVIWRTHTLR